MDRRAAFNTSRRCRLRCWALNGKPIQTPADIFLCFYIFWEVHVTHNPESTSRWGVALKHLQSSVAVCFKDRSLHRFGLVMSNFGVERERAGLRARA